MATTKYEILYIIRPNIDEDAKTALVERFDTILTENGATISETDKACSTSSCFCELVDVS